MSAEASTADAFYRRVAGEADAYDATPWTRGPWSAEHQHGGPVAALLAHGVEGELRRAAPDAVIVRLAVDFLRPAPLGRLVLRAETLSAGRRVVRVEARLEAAGVAFARASAVAIRERPVALPADALGDHQPVAEHEAPARLRAFALPASIDYEGFAQAIELRLARGRFGEPGAFAWLRMRVALLDGEAPTPFERIACAADAGHGIGMALDMREHLFVNPDLVIAAWRPLAGEWVGLRAEAVATERGVGLGESALYDPAGRLGRAMQTLIVEPRG